VRRIALYSDVHGNAAALEAVLADIQAEGLTERYCLGDLVGLGPRPNEAALLVRAAGDVVIQGNYDRAIAMHLLTPGSDFPSPQEALDGAESYAFTVSEIERDVADFLHALPAELRLEHDGVRLLLCHGTPSAVSGMMHADERPGRVVDLARIAGADIVCAGHTHVPFHRSIPDPGGPVHWVNPGSVGRPRDGDPRAGWAELVLGERAEVMAAVPMDTACRQVGESAIWLGVNMHRVAYDVEAVVREMTSAGLPHTLALGLRYGHEEHEAALAERTSAELIELPIEPGQLLPCGHTREACTCMYDDRTVAYECLARLYRGDISEVAAAVRRLRIAMRGCRINRHVDEAAILAAFEGADLALRTADGRTVFVEERERLYGVAQPFDPFVNVLSPEETTYLSGDIDVQLNALETVYEEASFTVPEVRPGVRSAAHIATELSFMAHCLRGAATGDPRALERARTFFTRHLGEWAVLFAVVVGQQAREPVMRYAGLALDKHLTCEGSFFRHNLPEHLELRAREQAAER
jgi:predicted phosphodiesterase